MDRPFTVCEYIWLDHNNNFRSKTRVIHTPTKELTGLLFGILMVLLLNKQKVNLPKFSLNLLK